MTERDRRKVEGLLKELGYSSNRGGFTCNQIHDMYDKLVRVGLLKGRTENA